MDETTERRPTWLRRILLVGALLAVAASVAMVVGPTIHLGGSWGYDRCLDAQEQGASRDLLIEHGCHLNMFSGQVMSDSN